ncbi:putative metabotropic glutamate receptor 4-like [Apostichopus japonicus]|uniref:Putative metabotropic glutamate receptor 4-like n=1 Tax=Stichopus japonicus TaxID=307972 RepID=A0A2G8JMQ0_STIJA|nr:putative metabotropic glutamate receptor 4-like [Apostichopus japonicus]
MTASAIPSLVTSVAGLQFVDSMSANGSCEDTSRTVGVVGTGSSLTSATVAKLLALFEVPQVSYSASSPIFSNKQEYPYFLRTVGPDTYQARVMVDIAKTYQWNYVALIYSDDQYGSPGQQALHDLFMQESICVVLMHRVSDDLEDDMELTTVVEEIKADEKIEVIFTFTSKSVILRVLQAAKRAGLKDRTWIATDSWSDSLSTIQEYTDVVIGMLGVSPRATVDQGFKTYLQEIDPLTYTDNPWYKESLDAYPECIMGEAGNYSCSNSEPFLDLLDSPNEGPVTSLIIDAVYALAHGLNDMIGNCTGEECTDISDYLEYVQNVSFSGFTNDPFLFDGNGDPYTQYSLFNLQNVSGKVLFQEVGFWKHDCGLNVTKPVVWPRGETAPVSRCSEDCQPGYHVVTQPPLSVLFLHLHHLSRHAGGESHEYGAESDLSGGDSHHLHRGALVCLRGDRRRLPDSLLPGRRWILRLDGSSPDEDQPHLTHFQQKVVRRETVDAFTD